MKHLLKTWQSFLSNDKNILLEKQTVAGVLLPLDVLHLLVKKYGTTSFNKTLPKMGYISFTELGGKEIENNFAIYLSSANTIALNSDKKDIGTNAMIEVIIHEARHRWQHLMWEGDDAFKEKFVKGYKLPKGKDIYDLTFEQLVQFWMKVYPYDQRPDERDAARFAQKHYQEGIQMVISYADKVKRNKQEPNIGVET